MPPELFTDTGNGDVYTCIAVSAGEDGGLSYIWVPGNLGTLAEIRAKLHDLSTALSNKADAKPPEWYDLPIDTSKFGGYVQYCKDQFERVTVIANLRAVDNAKIPIGTQIAVLPAGYRPFENECFLYYEGMSGHYQEGLISTGGVITTSNHHRPF